MSETFLADDLDFLGTALETTSSRMRCESKRGTREINEKGWIAKGRCGRINTMDQGSGREKGGGGAESGERGRTPGLTHLRCCCPQFWAL